jgi:hypothetical protein
MDDEELKRHWGDPANWTRWSYKCKEDPRLIVPKRNPALGWTINSAHRKAPLILLLGLLITVAAPAAVIIEEGIPVEPTHLLLSVLASGALLVAFCLYFSRNPKS